MTAVKPPQPAANAPGTPSQVPATIGEQIPAEIVIWETENPLALLNVVPRVIRERFEVAAKARPELFGVDERSLFKKLSSENALPSPTDNRLRLKFWIENDRIMMAGTGKMEIANVTANVCSREYFANHFLHDAGRVAWLLTPPSDYNTKTQETLDFALDQLRDVLEQPHVDPITKKINMQLVNVKAKIAAMLDTRVKGSVVKKNVNLNATASDAVTVARVAEAMTSSKLDDRIKEMERRNRRALHLPEETK